MTAPTLTCWSDESRGNRVCQRDNLADVNIDGRAHLGCITCKTVIGEAVGPATRACVPFADGWRKIPQKYIR